MESTKEFYEILKILKFELNNYDCLGNKEKFNKDDIKSMILKNCSTKIILKSLSDKRKINDDNKNIYYIIQNSHKKRFKENKIVMELLPKFSVFHNEPNYIEKFNIRIYNKIKENFMKLSSNTKLITIMNGYVFLLKKVR